MMAYLAMVAVRLIELHRVLEPTGSLYLHCDPTASHYLKLLLDGIFGAQNFRNEIVWRRSHPKGHAFTRFATTHDGVMSGRPPSVKGFLFGSANISGAVMSTACLRGRDSRWP